MKNCIKRTAVVTGGSGPVGLEIVRRLLSNGLNAVICSSSIEKGESALKKIAPEYSKSCMALGCHVDKPEDVKRCYEAAMERFGSVDVLINGAGAPDEKRFGEISFEDWRHCISSNLTGTFLMIKEGAKYLKSAKFPTIVNLSSVDGRMGGYEGGYGAASSKGGIISLTRAAARQLAGYGITVNCVAIGSIIDESTNTRTTEQKEDIISKIPLGRIGEPEDIAPAVCFLAGIESRYITGAVLDINGGMFMG